MDSKLDSKKREEVGFSGLLFDVGVEDGDAEAFAFGLALQESFFALGDVAPLAQVLAEGVGKEA